jgi:hypothetical protein
MKICSVCSKEKDVTEYYKGYAKCKSCFYEVIKKYRSTEQGKKVRQQERRRAKESGKDYIWQKTYDATEKGKERSKRYESKRYSDEKGKLRLAAKNAVRHAIKTGKLVKQPCFECGELNSVAHHSSYARYMRLVVTWLCVYHHNKLHNDFNKEGL